MNRDISGWHHDAATFYDVIFPPIESSMTHDIPAEWQKPAATYQTAGRPDDAANALKHAADIQQKFQARMDN